MVSCCLGRQRRGPHVSLEGAGFVDGKVPIARFACIDAVEALDGAVALEGGVLPVVGALGHVFVGGMPQFPTDVAAGVSWGMAALFRLSERGDGSACTV